MIEVTLEYCRVDKTVLSTGRILTKAADGSVVPVETFEAIEYAAMLRLLSGVLMGLPEETEAKVHVQRTDRAGILPYTLDAASVTLLRTDPVAGLEAMSVASPSPMQVLENIKLAARPPVPYPTLTAGAGTLADAFGETVACRIRDVQLECPGCGFWSDYALPAILNDPDRAGTAFKTIFVCRKRCHERFPVSCFKEWAFVSVQDLLKTPLPAFYLPRAWNHSRPWVSRDVLTQKYAEYTKEKEVVA